MNKDYLLSILSNVFVTKNNYSILERVLGESPLDEAIELKNMHNDIASKTDCGSISRFLKQAIEHVSVFTDLEIRALDKINTIHSNPHQILASHEFYVIDALAKAVADKTKEYNIKNSDLKRYNDVFITYGLNKEIDIVLANNGTKIYQSYLRLVTVLCESILTRIKTY